MTRQFSKTFQRATIVFAALVVTGCSSLPVQGPERDEIEAMDGGGDPMEVVLIDVSQATAFAIKNGRATDLGSKFERGDPANAELLGPGDVLNVSIWEADTNGLFSAGSSINPGSGSARGQVGGVEVDKNGEITFPYVGNISAAGQTVGSLAKQLKDNLSKKTHSPEVHIERIKKTANVVTVIGGVKAPGVYPLGADTKDILDVLAVAGGSSFHSYETMVRLTRGDRTAQTYLNKIIAKPENNIFLQPQDEVSFERLPLDFLVFGAVAQSGRYEFGQPKLTVLAALAKARGLDDNLADATGVFLFRFESESTVRALGLEVGSLNWDAGVPVIYRFDLRDAKQYFYAQSIGILDDDVLYVANAPAVGLSKFLKIIGQVFGIGVRTAVVATTVN
jgi:polysaccharide biosynthesis/export protein